MKKPMMRVMPNLSNSGFKLRQDNSLLHWSSRFAILAVLTLFALASAAGAQEKKSTSEALADFSDAANLQNADEFKAAAELWAKFLKNHSDDPLIPKAMHYHGVCLVQLEDFEAAIKQFKEVLTKFDKSELREDSMLNLGWSQYTIAGKKDPKVYADAAKTFRQLATSYPKGKYTDQALYFEGESYSNLSQWKPAIKAYSELLTNHPKSKLLADSLYAIGVAEEEEENWAAAKKYYDTFLAKYKDHELLTEVQLRKAETLLKQDQFEAASVLFAVVAKDKMFDAIDHAMLRHAFCLGKMEKFNEAGELYASIVQQFPKSDYLYDASMFAGRAYYRGKDMAKAKQWFNTVLESDGKHLAEAAHWLCRIHLKDKKYDVILNLVEAVLAKPIKSPYKVNLLMDRADARYEVEATRTQAMLDYAAISKEYPKSPLAPQALYNAAFAALELRELQACFAHVQVFRSRFPEDELVPAVEYVAGEAHLQQKEYPKAEAVYRALIKGYAKNAQLSTWVVRLGLVLYVQKKYDDAIAALEQWQSINSKPLQAEARFLTGASLFQKRQYAASMTALNGSLQIDPKWKQADEAMIFVSRCQFKQNKVADAIKTVQQCIEAFPASGQLDQAYYRLAEYRYAGEDYEGAAGNYGTVLKNWAKSPFASFSLYGLGWSYLKQKEYTKATTTFSSFISTHKGHDLYTAAVFARGMAYRHAGMTKEAVADLTSYLEAKLSDSDRAAALLELGLCHSDQKDYDNAISVFEELTKDYPNFPSRASALYELAWAYRNSKKIEASRKAFAELSAKYPKSRFAADAHFRLAEEFYAKGDYAKAIEHYEQADGAAGSLKENIYHKLGWAYFQQKDFVKAEANFLAQLKGFKDGPLAGDAQFMYGESLFQQRKFPEALVELRKSIAEKDKLSNQAFRVLATLHAGQAAGNQKQWKTALTYLEPLLKSDPESPYIYEVNFELGRAHQELGDVTKAQTFFEVAAKDRSDLGARSRFMAGEMAFARKKYDAAISQFLLVMFGFGGKKAPPATKAWQARAGYEAARCAEVQIGLTKGKGKEMHLLNARKYYKYVVDQHPKSEFTAKAVKRLEVLSRL